MSLSFSQPDKDKKDSSILNLKIPGLDLDVGDSAEPKAVERLLDVSIRRRHINSENQAE